MQNELQTALFQAFDTLNLQRVKTFSVRPVTLCGPGALSSCGQQAQTRGLKHLFVMADSFLHQAGMTAGLTRSLAVKGIAMTLWPCPVGEPCITDVCAAVAQLRESGCDGVIAFGGGSVLDAAKTAAAAIANHKPAEKLVGTLKVKKQPMPLIAVPTTAGTGSEVTNIAILALNSRGTKKGLAVDEMYADSAVLVPELLNGLPFRFFATSSIDALIHAVESSLSPKGNEMTRMFGYKAIDMILHGYKKIAANGPEARMPLLEDFLLASLYPGIAFGNAGCAAVHAMSYPLGATFHVAHGESNYAMFTGVMKNYMEIRQDGEIERLNQFIADILGCKVEDVYEELEKLLNNLIQKKALHEYGMSREQIEEFADSVIANQGRLMANNFVELDRDRLIKIYTELY